MTYRIGMWAVIALMVAQTGLYHLVIFPRHYRLFDRYSSALTESLGAMSQCSNLLDRMDERIAYLKGYIGTACAPDVREEMAWRIK